MTDIQKRIERKLRNLDFVILTSQLRSMLARRVVEEARA